MKKTGGSGPKTCVLLSHVQDNLKQGKHIKGGIRQERKGSDANIGTHAPHGTLLASIKLELWPVFNGSIFFLVAFSIPSKCKWVLVMHSGILEGLTLKHASCQF